MGMTTDVIYLYVGLVSKKVASVARLRQRLQGFDKNKNWSTVGYLMNFNLPFGSFKKKAKIL